MSTTVLAPEKEGNIIYEILRHEPLVFKSKMTTGQFHSFVLRHEDLKIERDSHGVVTIHPPMTFDSGYLEGEAFFQLKTWSKKDGTGKAFSPSTSFHLPDGSTYKADGAWISNEKIGKLSKEERKKIASIVPDFVMEVCSETDRISKLKEKMTDGWLANGVRLAWLIDPVKKRVFIYREGQKVEELKGLAHLLSGEDLLPGFEFDLSEMEQ
jgi:Uma2 family endonuclease